MSKQKGKTINLINFIRKYFELKKPKEAVEFQWSRLRVFDKDVCEAFYERIKDSGNEARVVKVTYKRKTKAKPIPMNTIEFQKLASRKLKIGSSKAMEIAEKLYNKGFISYPRTETNTFPEMNLREIVVELSKNSVFGEYANKILEVKGFYGPPKKGKLDDKAHPPIHPVKNAEQKKLEGPEWRVYELICKHFLSCLS